MDSKKNKGKSSTKPNYSFGIRFNPNDEELVEVMQYIDDCIGDKNEINEDESTSISSSQLSTPTSIQSSDFTLGAATSTSSSVLGRLSKRSSSLESTNPVEPGSGDTWRLFKEVRGRITKTVEEKIEDFKSERLKSNKNKQKCKLANKAENCSVSDSEEHLESSNHLKLSDSNLVLDNEAKVCDNQINSKKSDNHQTNSGRSTPSLVGNVTIEKEDVPIISKKNSVSDEKKKDKSGFSDSNKNDNKKENQSEEIKKEKKTKMFHFKDKFQSAHDKKKQDISFRYSALKNESEDEKEYVPVEYGLEASENLEDLAANQIMLSTEAKTLPINWLPFVKTFLWAWKYSIFVIFLAIGHYFWPANYLLGFSAGILVTSQVISAVNWIQEHLQVKKSCNCSLFEVNTIYNLTYPLFASSKYFTQIDPGSDEKINYEGWMNEYRHEYSPYSYHLSHTETIHVKIEGSQLTLSNPSIKIPKRALWNESEHKLLFNRQRLFDISGCKVQLLPSGLTHKRIWSKKYPICITLLKMSKLGIRYRNKGKITIEDDQPWLDPEEHANTPVDITDSIEPFPIEQIDSQSNKEEKIDEKSEFTDKPDGFKLKLKYESDLNDDPLRESSKSPEAGYSTNDEEDGDDDFVRISPSLLNEFNLYLFARCDRQKEIWFRRLVLAAGYQNQKYTEREIESNDNKIEGCNEEDKESSSNRSNETTEESNDLNTIHLKQNTEQQYLNYMNKLGQKKVPKLDYKDKEISSKHASSSKSNLPTMTPSQSFSSSLYTSDDMCKVFEEVMWVNAFAGRLLYDVLRDPFWLSKIQEKFQRKLSAIKLPYFMEELVISHIDFGESIPLIQRASRPILNDEGIWADLDVLYDGNFRVTIDTKLNLMKLKKVQASLDGSDDSILCVSGTNITLDSANISNDVDLNSPLHRPQKSAIYDSDVEDSAESSSEETDIGKGSITLPDLSSGSPGNTASHKMLRMVDKIAASKYFQQVTENKYIKRAMEGVSNTNIALVVEVRGLSGTLVLNFPPPPSDRLWYGFRSNPQLLLTAQPKVGDHTISLMHVSNWIERRLRREFQKLLVLPNMDDFIIPVMNKEQPS